MLLIGLQIKIYSMEKKKPSLFEKWRMSANKLKRETYALYLAVRDPCTPWYAKAFAGLVVAYAFSPIDLIPDFIPVLGYLDDLVLIPLGVAGAIKMIPPEVMSDCRARSEQEFASGKPVNKAAGIVIILIWFAIVALVARWACREFAK